MCVLCGCADAFPIDSVPIIEAIKKLEICVSSSFIPIFVESSNRKPEITNEGGYAIFHKHDVIKKPVHT